MTESSTLRAGAHATLILEDERLHIRVPVICVSGGAPGDKIRVTTINRHQTFEAVILNADELRGSF
jgi:flagella basal body P-ring formation protein FlgA